MVITILMVIHWGMDVFDFWPFSRNFLKKANPVIKGGALTGFCIAISLIVMLVLYDQIIGRFGAVFF